MTALLFLEDGETYSGLDGSIRIFFDLEDHEEIDDHKYKSLSIKDLLKQLIDKKELLPLEIQKLLTPVEDLEL
jgi:hypothetical protein